MPGCLVNLENYRTAWRRDHHAPLRCRPADEAERSARDPAVWSIENHVWAVDNHVKATDWLTAPAARFEYGFGLRARGCPIVRRVKGGAPFTAVPQNDLNAQTLRTFPLRAACLAASRPVHSIAVYPEGRLGCLFPAAANAVSRRAGERGAECMRRREGAGSRATGRRPTGPERAPSIGLVYLWFFMAFRGFHRRRGGRE